MFKHYHFWIIVLLSSLFTIPVQAQVYNGDMNHDGQIDVGDVQTLANVALGNLPKEEIAVEEESRPMRILSIGHSFVESAFVHLPEIVEAEGVDVSNICLYKIMMGSSGFEEFLNIFKGTNTKQYLCRKVFGGIDVGSFDGIKSTGESNTNSMFIREILKATKWDMIIISQVSSESEDASDWDKNNVLGAYLDSIHFYQPEAEIAYYIPYASYARALSKGKTTAQLAQLINTASKYLADKYNIKKIVPCATAIENLRQTKYNDKEHWMSDTENHHLTYGLARFTAGCVFYQSLLAPIFGKSIIGNTFRKEFTSEDKTKYSNTIDITDETAKYGHLAAYLAENFWNIIINPTSYVDYKEY